jgi:hypothetical protein
MTTPRGRHAAATATVPRSELPQVRLVLGTAAAAVGLFAALHWIVLPGNHLWLHQKNRRTESVAALDPAKGAGSRRNATAGRVGPAQSALRGGAAGGKARRQAQKAAPRTAGKPIGSAPSTKQPGAPVVGDPTASGGKGPAATETPAANQDSGSSSPPPPPPPPPPIGLPQLPQLPQVPEVPQVPVPSVPEVPKPQVPSVPTPQLPVLP